MKAQTDGVNLSNQLKSYDAETMRALIESSITRKLMENETALSKNQMEQLKAQWQFQNSDEMQNTWKSELINTQADAKAATHDAEIKDVAARFAKAQTLVNMITKGIGAGAGAIGATGILKATQSAVKNAKPRLSSKSVKTPGYEAVYNYK